MFTVRQRQTLYYIGVHPCFSILTGTISFFSQPSVGRYDDRVSQVSEISIYSSPMTIECLLLYRGSNKGVTAGVILDPAPRFLKFFICFSFEIFVARKSLPSLAITMDTNVI